MPEPAAAIEEPSAPVKETNPSLAALFKTKPVAPEESDIPGVDEPTPLPVSPAKEPAPAKEPEKPAEPAKDSLRSRLAPDFDAPTEPKKSDAPTEPIIEVTPEMIAAEKDPKRKASLNALGKQLSEYKRQVEELTNRTAAAPEEIVSIRTRNEELTKQNEELIARVERANLLDSPRFQSDHLIPRQRSYESLAGMVKESGGDPSELQRAIAMNGKERIEALDNIREDLSSPMLQSKFDRLIEDIDQRTQTINEALRNSKKTAEEQRRQDLLTREEQLQQEAKQWEGLLAAAERNLRDNHKLEAIQPVDRPGYEWWNDQIVEIRATARDILINATPEKAATAAVLAGTADAFRKMWLAEKAARIALDEQLAERDGVQPRLRSEREKSSTTTEPTTTSTILGALNDGKYKKR